MKQIETFYKCVFFMSKLYGKYLKNWRWDIDLFWTAQWLSNVDLLTGENLVGKARLRKRVLQMLLTGVSRSTGGRRVRSLVYVKFSIISRDVYVLIIFRRCLNLYVFVIFSWKIVRDKVERSEFFFLIKIYCRRFFQNTKFSKYLSTFNSI